MNTCWECKIDDKITEENAFLSIVSPLQDFGILLALRAAQFVLPLVVFFQESLSKEHSVSYQL